MLAELDQVPGDVHSLVKGAVVGARARSRATPSNSGRWRGLTAGAVDGLGLATVDRTVWLHGSVGGLSGVCLHRLTVARGRN